MKFKVGDKVRRSGPNCSGCQTGQIYTVKENIKMSYGADGILLDEVDGRFDVEFFDLVFEHQRSSVTFTESELTNTKVDSVVKKYGPKALGGVKHDQYKIDFSLMPIGPLTEVAKVWTFGKKKYAAWNWTKGFLWSRPYASALRHILSWASGEKKDPETGLSHLAHAICCLMMLIEFDDTETGENDLYYKIKQENNNGEK